MGFFVNAIVIVIGLRKLFFKYKEKLRSILDIFICCRRSSTNYEVPPNNQQQDDQSLITENIVVENDNNTVENDNFVNQSLE